nr:ribonuclease H-like domain-containing protein [Tanacetum cinerariifolium]
MADLAFAPQHNMIAYLEKTESNAEFHQIVDFLTLSSIHHSLIRALVFLIPGDLIFLIQGGGDSLVWASTTASLDAQQASSNVTKTQSKATLNEPTPQGEGSGSGPGRQETMGGTIAQIRSEGALIQSIDPPLSTGYTVRSREDRMEHDIELTDLVPQTPHYSPLSGGHTLGSDEGSMTLKELTDLCTTLLHKVLDLENIKTAQTKEISGLRRERKVSKQERKNLKSQQMFQDIDNVLDEDADTEMIVKDKGNGEKDGSTAETVSTARSDIGAAWPEDSTAEPKTPPTTTTFFDDEDVTIVDTLVKMKNQKAKKKGIAFKDADDSTRPIRSITTLQPFPTIDPKDKGKGILQELDPVKKSKKMDQDQIERDVEVALKIQAHLNEEAMIERKRQEEASKATLAEMYDEVQAKIDDDHELAVRLTHKEKEKYTVEERSKLLVKKGRNSRFTHAQLKSRSFEEIQMLYIKEQKWVDAFVPIGSEEDKKRIKSRKKRVVVPDDDKAIDYETLDVKSLILDCESQVLGNNKAGDVYVYKLTRLDGSYRHFLSFSKMIEVLDKQDVLDLHKIIMERFPANDAEGYDLILWGDLKTLVESKKRTEYQLADMFTKALPEDRFYYLVRGIGMRCLTPTELEVLANESA